MNDLFITGCVFDGLTGGNVDDDVTVGVVKMGREFTRRHTDVMMMCARRVATEEVFTTVANEIFTTGVNWGRIMSLVCLSAVLTKFVPKESVMTWLMEFVERELID